MMPDSVQARIDKLARGLNAYSSKLGYSEVRDRGRLVKYKVHTQVLGDVEIPIHPGRESLAKEKLLHELENLARHAKPSLLLADKPRLPHWLVPDAVAFCDHPQTGLHRFGKQITIRGTGAGGKAEEYLTKEQLIHASSTSLDIFRYFPTDRARYKDDLHYKAAMGWNFSMYHYIEKKGLPPSQARDTLSGLQRELINQILHDLAVPGHTGAAEAGGDIFTEVLTLIMRR